MKELLWKLNLKSNKATIYAMSWMARKVGGVAEDLANFCQGAESGLKCALVGLLAVEKLGYMGTLEIIKDPVKWQEFLEKEVI